MAVGVDVPGTNEPLFVADIANSVYSTSAQGDSFVEIGGRRYGHILNPQTGYPSSNKMVGVMTESAMLGDMVSTGLFTETPAGFLEKMLLLQKDFPIEGVLMDEAGNVTRSAGFEADWGGAGMNREALLTKMTKGQPVRRLADSPFLYMPMSAYRGHFARPVVREGERVMKYQLVAERKDAFSANVHASVSGTVVGVRDFSGAGGEKVPMLVLKNDFQDECILIPDGVKGDPSPEAVLQAIEEAGIVGAGGAQFPAALKYRVAGENIKTFIINGVECEPYLTADYSLMRERTEAFSKASGWSTRFCVQKRS